MDETTRMQSKLNPGEEGQLRQTVEMFEVITQTQPLDYQSLDILKEAYLKLGMDNEVVATCRRIASAYVQLGQLSSAIMEYETILQRIPDDVEATAAIKQLSSRAEKLNKSQAPEPEVTKPGTPTAPGQLDDGKAVMRKVFVEGKMITETDFEACWPKVSLNELPAKPIEPFIHLLTEKDLVPIEKSMRLISDRSRMPFLSIGRYDLDIELARAFPRATCRRWCVLPFDRMSKSIVRGHGQPVQPAGRPRLAEATPNRLLWYLVAAGRFD